MFDIQCAAHHENVLGAQCNSLAPSIYEKSTFGVPAAKLGIGYKAKGIMELERLVGPAFTAEIFYTGRQFSSEEAKGMRLVNHVVSEEK